MARQQNWETEYFVAEITDLATEPPTEESEEWKELAEGILEFDPSPEDETEEYYYYVNDGEREEVTMSISQIISVEGHREVGDEAQDLIADGELDKNKRQFYLKQVDGDGTYIGRISTSNIVIRGGAPNEFRPFNFEMRWIGQPVRTPKA